MQQLMRRARAVVSRMGRNGDNNTSTHMGKYAKKPPIMHCQFVLCCCRNAIVLRPRRVRDNGSANFAPVLYRPTTPRTTPKLFP